MSRRTSQNSGEGGPQKFSHGVGRDGISGSTGVVELHGQTCLKVGVSGCIVLFRIWVQDNSMWSGVLFILIG